MGHFLSRAQLCRLTSWIENHQCSVSSTSTILPFTRFRQCSTSPDFKTLNVLLSANPRNYGEEIERERAKRHEMVQKISRDVEILTCKSSAGSGVCDVYLVGTVHISQKSCKEVQEIIKFLKPEVVFLELCSSRKAFLTSKNLKIPTVEETIANLDKQPNLFAALLSWFYAEAAREFKFIPGSEFRVAYEETIKYGGRVALGDRPIKITLGRTWRKMPLWQKIKLFLFPFSRSVDANELQKKMEYDTDTLTLKIQEMSEKFPSLMETLVHERDQYMSSTLLKVASRSSSVVAVVGKGHLQGMKKHWKQPVVLEDLMRIPSQKATMSAVSLTSIVVVGVTLISGIYLSSKI